MKGNKTQINADQVDTALKTNFYKNTLIHKNKCIKKCEIYVSGKS